MTLKIFQHAATVLFAATSLHAQLSQEEFRKPPIQARPSALWTWLNGYVDHNQITRELEEMKAKGMRGAIIWDLGALADPEKIIPAGPEFLGPESLKSIHHALDEAERLGLEMGIIAASSWNSGGTWITPENASKALLWSETRVKGPSEFSAVLPLPEKAGAHIEDVAVVAAGSNKSLRLDTRLSPDGRLTWPVPEGEWSILRFIRSNTGEFLNCPSHAMDFLIRKQGMVHKPLDMQASARFLVEAANAAESVHPTPGLGSDHRLRFRWGHGTALRVDDTIVHLALFGGISLGKGHHPSEPPLRRRRDWI